MSAYLVSLSLGYELAPTIDSEIPRNKAIALLFDRV
jgi:hypothetical protein